MRLGEHGAAYHWERAVAVAVRTRGVPLLPATAETVNELMELALDVALRWDPEVEHLGFDVLVNPGRTTYQLGARLFGESVYVTVNT